MRMFSAESIQWKSLNWEEGLTSAKVSRSEVSSSHVLLQQKYLDQALRLLNERERNLLGELSESQEVIGRLLATIFSDQTFSTFKVRLGSRVLKSFCLVCEELDYSQFQMRFEMLCSIVNSKPFFALNSRGKELFLDLFDICPISFKHELMQFVLTKDYSFGRYLNVARNDQNNFFKCLYDSCHEAQMLKCESCWLQLATLLLQHVSEVIEGAATEGRKKASIKILANLFRSILQEQLHPTKTLSNR